MHMHTPNIHTKLIWLRLKWTSGGVGKNKFSVGSNQYKPTYRLLLKFGSVINENEIFFFLLTGRNIDLLSQLRLNLGKQHENLNEEFNNKLFELK